MSESELRVMWGREVLRERGVEISDDDYVSFELTVGGDGCCELCYSEHAILHVTGGGRTVSLTWGDF